MHILVGFFIFILEDEPKVAFLATLETGGSVSAGSTIIFDSVITNTGNGYNVDDGIFTAKGDGIYQFSASVMSYPQGEVWAFFSLNGKRIAFIYARASDHRYDQGANSVILELKKGDTVRVVSQHTVKVYGDGYSTFSGQLL